MSISFFKVLKLDFLYLEMFWRGELIYCDSEAGNSANRRRMKFWTGVCFSRFRNAILRLVTPKYLHTVFEFEKKHFSILKNICFEQISRRRKITEREELDSVEKGERRNDVKEQKEDEKEKEER